MSGVPFASPIQSDIPIIVADDIACRKCSYNLRGLFGDGRCPECGTPVGFSLRGDLLRYADPEWVQKLATGVRYIFLGILVAVIIGGAGSIATRQSRPYLSQLIGIVAGLVSYYGTWLLTEPDPSGIGEDPTVSARKFMRLALLVGIASQVCTVIVQLVPMPGFAEVALLVIVCIAGLVGVAGEFARFTYYRALASRIPDEKLAQRAHFLRWAYIIPTTIGLIVGTGILILFVTGGPTALTGALNPAGGGGAGLSGLMWGGICVAGIASIAAVVFGIMAIRLLWALGKRFKEQAALARANWQVGGVGPELANASPNRSQ